MKQPHSPPDNLSLSIDKPFRDCWEKNVSTKRYFNEITDTTGFVRAEHFGYESDRWPNPDDEIPEYDELWRYCQEVCVKFSACNRGKF
ncbi:hypothetical protein, partial [Candidatus Entotheonella palauensis]|uniref:hypothetical protein n=1 Tax=Candidatus Entotheonella palauensis TaxID=93172 RepID=UPI001C4DEBA2